MLRANYKNERGRCRAGGDGQGAREFLEGLRRLGNGLYGITEVILNPRGKGRSNQISSWNRIAIVRRKAMSISLKFVKSNLVLAAV